MNISESSVGWYPSRPPAEIPKCDSDNAVNLQRSTADLIPPVESHPIWKSGLIKYTSQNWWSNKVSKEKKEASRRLAIPGVVVKDLPADHFLHGQQGLFATSKFSVFDVIGEYTGRIVDSSVSGT